MEEITSFGPWLRRQRKGRDLTQDALARQVGCAVITIQKIEADERRPSQDIAARLADILEVPMGERTLFLKVARGELAVDNLDGGAQVSWHPVAPPLHNLPAPPNPLIGRMDEVEELLALVRRPDVRLITLTGPGGTGKTRLGVRVATELLTDFTDGVRFVPLAAITDPTLVLPTIAQVLGVRQSVGQSLQDSLETALHGRNLLLVLDNFEQVLDAALDVAALLDTAPRLSVLVTSRAPLHLSGEHEFAVSPLALPVSVPQMPLAQLTQYAAVALFIARVQAVRRDFRVTDATAPAIAAICARLDGLPLAIELAAVRCKVLTPEAILARLEHRFELLTGGARNLPARQQTIRATMDWSYTLLDAREQQLFWRLAVFAGSWTLEATEAVCDATGDLGLAVLDGLQSLVDASLVEQTVGMDGEQRFTMLETMREYARERLESSGEATALRHRHAAYFLDLAEAAEHGLRGPEQLTWLTRLEVEHDNLRTVVAWSHATPEETEVGLRLVGALWQFLVLRGHFTEWLQWLERLVAVEVPVAASAARAKAVLARGFIAVCLNDAPCAITVGMESLADRQAHGDAWGSAAALLILGYGEGERGQQARELAHLGEAVALARSVGDPWLLAWTLYSHGWGHPLDRERIILLEEALALAREVGDAWLRAWVLKALGFATLNQDNHGMAAQYFAESLALRRALGDQLGAAHALLGLGVVAAARHDYVEARTHNEERLEIEQQLGNQSGIAHSLRELGVIAMEAGDYREATRCLEASLVLYHKMRTCLRDEGIAFLRFAEVAERQGDYHQATERLKQRLKLAREAQDPHAIGETLQYLAEVAQEQGDYHEATERLQEGMRAAREAQDYHTIALMFTNLGRVALAQHDLEQAAKYYQDSLPYCQEVLPNKRPVSHFLAGLAGVAGEGGKVEEAARLFGAAWMVREQVDGQGHAWTLATTDHADYIRRLNNVRSCLDEPTFTAAWAEGQMMTLEQAIGYAMETPA